LEQGHVREVDLLVAAPTGLFLIEIKNFRGRLTNSGSLWQLTGQRTRSFDNPLSLADQKAKELKSLLARAVALEAAERLTDRRQVARGDAPHRRVRLVRRLGQVALSEEGRLAACVVHRPVEPACQIGTRHSPKIITCG
jgi:hypothetical protein